MFSWYLKCAPLIQPCHQVRGLLSIRYRKEVAKWPKTGRTARPAELSLRRARKTKTKRTQESRTVNRSQQHKLLESPAIAVLKVRIQTEGKAAAYGNLTSKTFESNWPKLGRNEPKERKPGHLSQDGEDAALLRGARDHRTRVRWVFLGSQSVHNGFRNGIWVTGARRINPQSQRMCLLRLGVAVSAAKKRRNGIRKPKQILTIFPTNPCSQTIAW